MKRNILVFLSVFLLSGLSLLAQDNSKKFSGTITYRITYPSQSNNPMVAALPTTLEMQISGNKAKTQMMLPFGNNTFIMDGDLLNVIRLVELETGKYFIKKTKDDFNMTSTPMIVPLKETKTIAGQNCKAAEVNVTVAGKSSKSKVYYSETLGANNIYFNTNIRSLKGIMLEFEYTIMGIPVQLSAISVNPGRVSSKEFEIPAGYTETTEAKLREMKGPAKK